MPKMIDNITENVKHIVARVPGYSFTLTITQNTLNKSEELLNYSKNKISLSTQKIKQTKLQTEKKVYELFQIFLKQVFDRTQKKLHIQGSQIDLNNASQRATIILNTVFRDYIIWCFNKSIQIGSSYIKVTENFLQSGILPFYIPIKATILVSKEMIIESIEGKMGILKMNFQDSQNNITMYIKGKFQEQQVMKRVKAGVQNFKEFTIKFAKKGLLIQVDKESLMANYEQFSEKFLDIIKQMRDKSTQGLLTVRQKSVSAYEVVLKRIKQKEIQIRIDLKQIHKQ